MQANRLQELPGWRSPPATNPTLCPQGEHERAAGLDAVRKGALRLLRRKVNTFKHLSAIQGKKSPAPRRLLMVARGVPGATAKNRPRASPRRALPASSRWKVPKRRRSGARAPWLHDTHSPGLIFASDHS